MGAQRNGAREFLNLSAKVCKLSRMPGFQTGLITILGEADATNLLNGFAVYCAIVDGLISVDNWFNQKDHTDDDSDGEDAAPLG